MKPYRRYILFLLLLATDTLQVAAGVADHPFSVSADRQVLFSPGNLQFNAAQGSHSCADGTTQPGTWRFAEHQYDLIGEDNKHISETYDGWIDLFSWGTSGWNSGANVYQPWVMSTNYSDFYPGGSYTNNLTGDYAYADWGVYNQIGNDVPGTWRTLTKDEWGFLINTRPNAGSKYGVAKVNGVAGLVILPDDFTLPTGCGFTAGMTNASKGNDWSEVASTNIYTLAQWQQMEAAGAVFIPCAGRRNDTKIEFVGTYGACWSSTADNSNDTYGLGFESNVLYWRNGIRNHGYSVRLVKDVAPAPPSAYEPKPFCVSADRQILFSPGNLQYNAAQGTHSCADGTTQPGTWRFAEHQYDYVGNAEYGTVYINGVKCNNELISETYDGWIDLFGWGTSGWNSGANEYLPWATSESDDDYTFADWGTYNQIGDDAPGTWRTLTGEEWKYIFEERPNYANLRGQATINEIVGYIFLPDNWEAPEGISFTSGIDIGYAANVYNVDQWSKMEAVGAVFLPAAGSRKGTGLFPSARNRGAYWSSSTCDDGQVLRMFFRSDLANPACYNRFNGRSVRLVKDITSPPPEDQCTDVATEFSYTMYEGETYLWEGTEYKTSGDHTRTFPKTDGCDSIVTLHLTVLTPECLGNYDTVRFCPDLNIEHDEVVRHGYCLRYLPYRYESPTEWNYMEGVVLVRESDRTLVDLAHAECNLREHYTGDLTPVLSVHWELCKEGTNDYHAVTVESEAQWIEAGTLSLSVYFLCGQRYYSDFTTDLSNVQSDHVPCTKVLRNGHIFILRGDHLYDATGKMVK